LGGLIIFQQGSDIENLAQIGRIYAEGAPGVTIDPSHQIVQEDAQKLFVVEKSPLPLLCAPGPGYKDAEACIPHNFLINTKKSAGGGWPIETTITDPDGTEVPCDLVQEGDAWSVSYTPPRDGEFTCKTTFQVVSTVRVVVGAMEPDPLQCIAYGPGLDAAEQYKPAVFTVESRNKMGRKLPVGGHPFNVAVKGPLGDEVDATINDNHDGTYEVTYTPVFPGDHVIEVKLKDDHIKDSPFHVHADYSSEVAHPAQSWAEGPGLKDDVCSTRMPAGPAEFTIHAVDVHGNPRKVGGDLFSVMIEDPLFNSIPATITDNNDGTYLVTYVPKEPGVHLIDVVLRNKVKPVVYEHIKDSTFNVKIKAGTDPSKCTAEGPGLKDGILDTFPAKFTIQARDRDGNPIPEGGDDFQVKVVDPAGNECPVDIVDNGDGTYDVTYQPDIPGPHVIKTTLDDINIKDSPKTVLVKPGAYFGTSYIEVFSYIIRTCDKRGNPLTTGGQDVKSLLSDTTGSDVQHDIKDNGNGTYTVTYKLPRVEGQYDHSARVDGKDIIGSPWNQTVGPVDK